MTLSKWIRFLLLACFVAAISLFFYQRHATHCNSSLQSGPLTVMGAMTRAQQVSYVNNGRWADLETIEADIGVDLNKVSGARLLKYYDYSIEQTPSTFLVNYRVRPDCQVCSRSLNSLLMAPITSPSCLLSHRFSGVCLNYQPCGDRLRNYTTIVYLQQNEGQEIPKSAFCKADRPGPQKISAKLVDGTIDCGPGASLN